VAIRAKAFGMKIQYHNRSRLPAELEGDATYVSFDVTTPSFILVNSVAPMMWRVDAFKAKFKLSTSALAVHHLTPANREQEMAIRAKAFGMKIQYHNRSRLPARHPSSW
jgi:lactate dehydrogenase-like 2-hydroxyacid dehydrogenase